MLTFVVIPIILNFTSKSLYGFWVTSLSVLFCLGLVDLGIGMSLTRTVAGLSDNLEESRFSQVVSTAFFTFCLAGLVFAGIGLSISSYIPVWFKIPADEFLAVISAYRIVVIAGALALPLSTFNAVIAGVQRMAVNNIVRSLSALSGIGVSILLLYNGLGLSALAISSLFTVLVTGVVSYFFCKYRYCPQLKISASLVNKADFARLWSFGGYFQLGRIAYMVTINTDAILIAVVLGAAAVTPYTLTSKLAILVSVTIASKLPIALLPGLSHMFARRETDKLRRAYIGLAYYSSRIAIMGGVFLILANRHFVSLWVGQRFFGGEMLNVVFVSWVLLDTIFRGAGIVVVASGDLRNWAIASIVEALLNIVISLLLVGPLGLIGIALGTTISRLLTTDIYIPIITCRKLQLSIWTFVWKGVISPILRSLPAICLVVCFVMLLPFRYGWTSLILLGLAIATTNVLSFEFLELAKSSDKPFRKRLWNILLLRTVLN